MCISVVLAGETPNTGSRLSEKGGNHSRNLSWLFGVVGKDVNASFPLGRREDMGTSESC